MVAHPLFCFLHPGKSRIVDADPDDGARPGAAHSGQRYRPRPDDAEPAANRRAIRETAPADAVAPRHQPGGDRLGATFYSGGAGHDRPDDRARRWSTPRLGATAAIAGGIMRSNRLSRGEAPPTGADLFTRPDLGALAVSGAGSLLRSVTLVNQSGQTVSNFKGIDYCPNFNQTPYSRGLPQIRVFLLRLFNRVIHRFRGYPESVLPLNWLTKR